MSKFNCMYIFDLKFICWTLVCLQILWKSEKRAVGPRPRRLWERSVGVLTGLIQHWSIASLQIVCCCVSYLTLVPILRKPPFILQIHPALCIFMVSAMNYKSKQGCLGYYFAVQFAFLKSYLSLYIYLIWRMVLFKY